MKKSIKDNWDIITILLVGILPFIFVIFAFRTNVGGEFLIPALVSMFILFPIFTIVSIIRGINNKKLKQYSFRWPIIFVSVFIVLVEMYFAYSLSQMRIG